MYLTLPASVQTDKKNTSSRYKTRLPETLVLRKGYHVIGLTEIIFPASYYNVHTPMSFWITDDSKERFQFNLPTGNYTSPESIVKALNNHKKNELVHFSLEKTQSLISAKVLKPNCSAELSSELKYFLGFEKGAITKNQTAARPIDFSNNISSMYIYSDVVDYSIVGSVKSNLLQCIPTPGASEFGTMQSKSFNPVRYLPIANDHIDSITIELLDEFGKPFQFNFGSTVVTLHVKTLY